MTFDRFIALVAHVAFPVSVLMIASGTASVLTFWNLGWTALFLWAFYTNRL